MPHQASLQPMSWLSFRLMAPFRFLWNWRLFKTAPRPVMVPAENVNLLEPAMTSIENIKASIPQFMNLPQEIRLQILAEVLDGIKIDAIATKIPDKPKRVIDPVKEFEFYPLNGDLENPADPDGEWRRPYIPIFEADYVGSGIISLLSINRQIYHEVMDILKWQTRVTFCFRSTVAMLDVLLGDYKLPIYKGAHFDPSETNLTQKHPQPTPLAAQIRRVEFIGTPLCLHGAISNGESGPLTHDLRYPLMLLESAGMKLDFLTVYDPYLHKDDGYGRKHFIWEMKCLMCTRVWKELHWVALQPYLHDKEVKDLAMTASVVVGRRQPEGRIFHWNLPTTPVQRDPKTNAIAGLSEDAMDAVTSPIQSQQSLASDSNDDESNQPEQADQNANGPSNDLADQAQMFAVEKQLPIAAIFNTDTGQNAFLNLESLTYNTIMSVTAGNKVTEDDPEGPSEKHRHRLCIGGIMVENPKALRIRTMGPLPSNLQVFPAKQEVAMDRIDPTFPIGSTRVIIPSHTPVGPLRRDDSAQQQPAPRSVMHIESIPLRPYMTEDEIMKAENEAAQITWNEKYKLHRDKIGWGKKEVLVMSCKMVDDESFQGEKAKPNIEAGYTDVLYSLFQRMTWKEVRESMDYLSTEGKDDVCSLL